MLKAYRILSTLLHPAIIAWLRWRTAKGKEDPKRRSERFGQANIPRPDGQLVWIHAASVGEAHSVLPLIEALCERYPQANILLTTGTVSSSTLMQSRLPERAFHQFVPVDTPLAVKRFLSYWQPDLAIWVESEFWPNLLRMTRQRNCPIVLVNARMSDRSYKRWQRHRGFITQLLNCFHTIYAGSRDDKSKFRRLGAEQTEYIGNIKYDAPKLPADPKTTSAILGKIGDRRVWLAASTHEGEEEKIAEVHRALKETYSDLLTIIVPRHAHRGEEVVQALSGQKFTVSCRSKQQVILPETDIYVADTMGELGIFYRLTGIVFIGGSLVPHGGHNPLEPAQLDCAIVCGPHMENFQGMLADLREENAITQVHTLEELQDKVLHLLRDQDMQESLAKNALNLVKTRKGVIANILNGAIANIPGFSPPIIVEPSDADAEEEAAADEAIAGS